MAEEKKAKQPQQPAKKKGGGDPAKTYANKMRRLQRHLNKISKRNARRLKKGKSEIGTDDQAQNALGKLDKKGSVTPRSKPKAEKWTRLTKTLAHQHRIAGYNGNTVLRFGMEGTSIYAGMKEYANKESSFKKAKFLNALQQKRQQEDDVKKAERQKQVDAERKKFHDNKKPKGKKPGQPKKPQGKPQAQK